jgi:zinc transport system permease protein
LSFVDAVLAHEFLRVALVAGLLAAVGCRVVGTLGVVKRITFMAGGFAHAVRAAWAWRSGSGANRSPARRSRPSSPRWGGSWIARRGGEREDMRIGALWAAGMAVGIVAIARTPGYSTDLMDDLMGNLLMASRERVAAMAVLDSAMLLAVRLFWRPLVATTLDEEFARLRGLPTLAIELVILVAVALALVLLMQAVRLVRVLALLTLPAATALLLAGSIGRVMVLAGVIAGVEIVSGLGLAFETDAPARTAIVFGSAAVHLLALTWRRLRMHRSPLAGRPSRPTSSTAQGASR